MKSNGQSCVYGFRHGLIGSATAIALVLGYAGNAFADGPPPPPPSVVAAIKNASQNPTPAGAAVNTASQSSADQTVAPATPATAPVAVSDSANSSSPLGELLSAPPAPAVSTDSASGNTGSSGTVNSSAATGSGQAVATPPSPLIRPVDEKDPSAKLAAEVPDDSAPVAIPDKKWLGEEVGPIASRPVENGVTKAEPIATTPAKPADKPADQASPASTAANNTGAAQNSGVLEAVQPKQDDKAVASVEKAGSDATKPAVADSQIADAKAEPDGNTEKSKKPIEPTIVYIKADYSDQARQSDKDDGGFVMKGASALPEPASGGRFALVWIDGSQRSGDTFVKFWKPDRIFFNSGKECLGWAKEQGLTGKALSPDGKQPPELQAACASLDGSNEFWLWRKRSGAFSKSELMPSQLDFFKEVIKEWSAGSKLAYQEFPEVPYAGE